MRRRFSMLLPETKENTQYKRNKRHKMLENNKANRLDYRQATHYKNIWDENKDICGYFLFSCLDMKLTIEGDILTIK